MKQLALLLLVAPLALAACGGSSPSSAPKLDPVSYVQHAASKSADLTSEHMSMTGSVSVAGQSVSLSGNGDFANNPVKGSFNVSIGASGQTIGMNEVIDGTTIYVRSPLFAAALPSGKTWVKADMSQLGKSMGLNYSSLTSQTPAQMFRQIEAAGSVKNLGAETIDGVATTHYQVTKLDLSKIPQGSKLEALAHPTYGPVDVWIGNSDGYIYRESLSATYSVQGQSGSVTMKADYSKFNEGVVVDVPGASDTVDMSSLMKSGGNGG